MGFLGFALVYAMRVNLSITIVAMVNKTQPLPDNGTDHHECPSLEPSGNGTGNHTIIPVSYHRCILNDYTSFDTSNSFPIIISE